MQQPPSHHEVTDLGSNAYNSMGGRIERQSLSPQWQAEAPFHPLSSCPTQIGPHLLSHGWVEFLVLTAVCSDTGHISRHGSSSVMGSFLHTTLGNFYGISQRKNCSPCYFYAVVTLPQF